jgi:pimeloyl-ACP methyl ester carboxylesterase
MVHIEKGTEENFYRALVQFTDIILQKTKKHNKRITSPFVAHKNLCMATVELKEPLLASDTTTSPVSMGNKAVSQHRLEEAAARNSNAVEDLDSTSEDALMAGLSSTIGEEKTPPPAAATRGQRQRQGNSSSNRRPMREGSHHDNLSQLDPELRAQEDKGPSYWAQIKTGYAEAVNAIIRPPRARYSLGELGPPKFTLGGLRYQRTDFVQTNARGLKVQCSWWEPVAEQRVAEKLPCVVYMHGNSSCRGEAVEILPMILDLGCTLVTFDFCGCGMSDGDFISLGWYERDDAQCVVEHLRGSGTVSSIGMWGRSMGAATALMHGHRDNCIAAMVLDSSFASLEKLVYALYESAGDQLKYVPRFTVALALRIVRSTIMKRCGFDILKLRPVDNVQNCFIPAIFICGKQDRFIHPSHSQDIHANYAGEKNLIEIEGDHNSNRPRYCMDAISIFMYQRLCVAVGLTTEELSSRRREKGMLTIPSGVNTGRPSNIPGGGGRGSSSAGGSGGVDTELQRALMLSMQAGGASGGGGVSSESNFADEEEMTDDVFVQTHMEQISLLVSMGFEPSNVLSVLKSTYGNVEMATQILCDLGSDGGKGEGVGVVGGGSSGGGGSGGGGGNTCSTEGSHATTGSHRGVVSGMLSAVPQNTVPDRANVNVFQEEVEVSEVQLDE